MVKLGNFLPPIANKHWFDTDLTDTRLKLSISHACLEDKGMFWAILKCLTINYADIYY